MVPAYSPWSRYVLPLASPLCSVLPSPRPLPSVPPSPRPFAPFPLRRRHGGRVQVCVPGLRRRRYRHPGHVGLHVCFRLLRDRRLHVLQGHRQLLHLRLHRGLALQVVRDDWNKCVMGISEASTTATSFPCASTSPAHSSASAGPATSVTATTAAPCATAATASWASAASRARPTGTSA